MQRTKKLSQKRYVIPSGAQRSRGISPYRPCGASSARFLHSLRSVGMTRGCFEIVSKWTRSWGAALLITAALGFIMAGCQIEDGVQPAAESIGESIGGVAGLKALRLFSPLQVTLNLGDAEPDDQRHTVNTLLEHLGGVVAGEDSADGTSYEYSFNPEFRSIQISATRAAWNDHAWIAEVRVISSDLWQDSPGQVVFLCLFVYGDGGSLFDAEDAASRIHARLDRAVSMLVAATPFDGHVAV